MLELDVQLIPLVLELLDDPMHFVNLSVVIYPVSLEGGNLLLQLTDLLLGQVLLLLDLLAKR